MEELTETSKSTENNISRQDVPELPLLRNCLFPEQFNEVPFRFRYQPPEDHHDVTTGSHYGATSGSQSHYITQTQMETVSSDVNTEVHDIIATSQAGRTSGADSLLSHDLQIHGHTDLEIPKNGSSLDHMGNHLGKIDAVNNINSAVGRVSPIEHRVSQQQLDSTTGLGTTSDTNQIDAESTEQVLDSGSLQDAVSHSPLDGTVSIDSPEAGSPCLDDMGTSRMDRQTPDMSLSSSLSTNLNSSVSSSPMTPLNQDCSGMASPEVRTVSSASYLHDDSGIDDSSHSSGQKCTLLETSCHDDSLSTRAAEDTLHLPYRTYDYGLMGMYPTSPYAQAYSMDPTFSHQRFAYPPRDMRTEHMFTSSHTIMDTHDDSGIDNASRSATYYNFQPMTPNNSLANWLTRTNQMPMSTSVPSSRGQRQDSSMLSNAQRSTQSADSSGDIVCEKPPDTYISLISQAILNSPEQRLILSEIYKYIRNTFPYYKTADDTWKNAIRHNLSVNECFVKNGRAPNGRGYYWSIHPACVRSFMEGDFRRREARRLARDANKTREGQLNKQAQGRIPEPTATTPRRGRSMSLAKVMGLPSPSPMMPASPALIPITCGSSYYPSHPATTLSASSPIPPPPTLSYPHPYLSAYYSPSSSYSLPYPPLPSPISNPQGSYPHMSSHVNPSSFSLSIPTIYGNLPSSSNSNLQKSEYQS